MRGELASKPGGSWAVAVRVGGVATMVAGWRAELREAACAPLHTESFGHMGRRPELKTQIR